MAVSNNVYSGSEWRLAIIGESVLGTANVTTMQLVDIDGDVTVNSEIVQTLDPRSGEGRNVKTADVFTSDLGGQLSTITFDCVLDTTVSVLLHASASGVAATGSPSASSMAFNYAPAGILTAATSLAAKDALTVALIPPVTDTAKVFRGCSVSELNVTYDSSVESGRGHASVTIETRYRPADQSSTPSSMAAFGTTYRYLREFGVKKTISSADVVLNKINYIIKNPVTYSGFMGAAGGDIVIGDPEVLARAIPMSGFELNLGVKYDATTDQYWQSRRAGSTFTVELSNHATWASATFGLRALFMKITETPNNDTDSGVFQDLALTGTASTTGNIYEIVT